jgi:hypothetical protein
MGCNLLVSRYFLMGYGLIHLAQILAGDRALIGLHMAGSTRTRYPRARTVYPISVMYGFSLPRSPILAFAVTVAISIVVSIAATPVLALVARIPGARHRRLSRLSSRWFGDIRRCISGIGLR